MVDKSIHSVPLEDIIFDTFGDPAGNVSLDRAAQPLILDLRDAIMPIAEPVYGPPDSLPWLDDDDLVIGYDSGDEAYAYPVNVLDRHELVSDLIEDVPVLITYCPLCFSGVVYGRELDGRVLTFGNTSALYQSDLVMYDHQTGSYWFQVGGEAVVGPLTDSRLSLLPSTTMAWGEWRRLYPETRLLTGIAGNASLFSGSRYGRDFPESYQARISSDGFVFPVHKELLDPRLSSGEMVLTVEVAGATTAYPLDMIGDGAVNHRVGGRPVVVFALAESRAVGAFSPEVEGRALTFDYRDRDQTFVDRETGSVWDAAGRAGAGPLAGAQLERLNTRRAFWFSIAIAFPDIDVYLP
ncbi:MAG: DUF3179 domain-containing protein [Dehalococcoidia bacterium]|jgi:hypothetical protein|nr:DUF3179 domain-containing protein [Dehalococcoidia bacterium]